MNSPTPDPGRFEDGKTGFWNSNLVIILLKLLALLLIACLAGRLSAESPVNSPYGHHPDQPQPSIR